MFFKKSEKSFGGGKYDYMVVGLGNPGREYENTRHNAGFIVMDGLCEKLGCSIDKLKYKSYIGECVIDGKRILLMKPCTFMNLSGEAVRDAREFYKIPPENTLIIFDDISLPVGKIRIKRGGSDGGHNGMKNIIYHGRSDAFPRIKVGVGAKPHPDYDLKDWVLSKFKGEDAENILIARDKAVNAIIEFVNAGVDSAMNKYSNR